MPLTLFDAPLREPSQFVAFAGNPLDRQSEKRSDDAARAALDAPGVRLMALGGGRLFLRFGGERPDIYFDKSDLTGLEPVYEEAVLLGSSTSGPIVAVPCRIAAEAVAEPFKALDYRSVYAQGLLEPQDLAVLAQAGALMAWHATHRFCGRCGGPTEMGAGGYKRVCTACQAEHFPRTDPVAIMLTISGARCLLGRGRHFAPGMYSALAGFIEPGETIEEAVRRETFEEAGIRLGRVVYHASQPWPFPYSLMIGCHGEALNEDIRADLEELEDCRWFDRQQVRQMLDGTHPRAWRTPPPGSIAHHLIRAWVDSD